MSAQRTVYDVNGSIPNWRVLLALHEKRLEFVPRRLRLMGGVRETRSPELLQINPRGLSLKPWPKLRAYAERVQARPAAVASHPEGWLPDRTGKPDLFALARAAAAHG